MTLLAMRSGCDRKRPFNSDYMALMDFARTRSQISGYPQNKSAATQRNVRLGSFCDVTAALMDVRFLVDVSRGGGGLPLCARSRRLSRMRREHDGQHGCPQNRAEERPKNPREGQRYRDNQQQKGAVFEGAHAPVPLRALNLVIRDMENRKIREHNTN